MDPPKTIFCDIDGTLVEHKGDIVKNANEPSVILDNVLESLKQWDKNNYRLILTTGRKESLRESTTAQLLKAGVIFDDLIMGLPNGDRILINDRKPRGSRNTAYAINVVRNKGLANVDLTSPLVTTAALPIGTHIDKPWGYEELIECNDSYVVKKLFMKAGHKCSLQYHELKRETITVFSGTLRITIGPSIERLTSKDYTAGESVTIPPYVIHRMEGVEDSLYYETSTNQLWDVVRLEDSYGRV